MSVVVEITLKFRDKDEYYEFKDMFESLKKLGIFDIDKYVLSKRISIGQENKYEDVVKGSMKYDVSNNYDVLSTAISWRWNV